MDDDRDRRYSRGRGGSRYDGGREDNGGSWRGGGGGGRNDDYGSSADGGYGGFGRNDSITMHVQDRYVGRIIGRGGSTIKQLQSDSGARIKISKDAANGEVPVEISGDEESRNRAKDMIDDLIGGGGYNRGREENNFRSGGGNDTVLKMDVAASDTGRVIGRGGEKIRQLQSEFRIRIKILQDDGDEFSTPIELTGDAKDCERAKKAINDHLAKFKEQR